MGIENYLYAADTVNVQAGGRSFFEEAGDALTKGAGAAMVSGLASIYNTGVRAINYFGAEVEEFDVARALSDVDQNWGDYYREHQQPIDTIGFIAGSFIPGGLAIKGLKMAQAGKAGGVFARTLGYATTRQTANLNKALQVIASPEGSVFTRMNKNYLAALGWGTADGILQTAAFEIAVATTMNASPLLDGSSFKDLSYDIIKSSLVGGAFFGGIEGLLANRIIKDATKLIDRTGAKYTTLHATERLGLGEADNAYQYIDAVMDLPQRIFDEDKALKFVYSLNGTTQNVTLDTAKLYERELTNTVKSAYLRFEHLVNNNLADDPTTGKALAKVMLDIVGKGKAAGKAPEEIRARLGDFLFNLRNIEAVGSQGGDLSDDTLKFFNRKGKLPSHRTTSIEFPGAEGPLSSFKHGSFDVAVRLTAPPEDLKVTLLGMKGNPMLVSEAWDDGFDLALKADGTWTINPKSAHIKYAKEPTGYQTFLNTHTGKTSDTATLTVADIATKEVPLQTIGDRILAGERSFRFSLASTPAKGADSVEWSARHLWASKLEKIDGTVSADDFGVLDRMSSAKNIVADTTSIQVPGIQGTINWRDLGNFDDWVFSNKLATLQNELSAGERNIQELAIKLNATPEWIQNAIASKFNLKLMHMADGAPDLSQGWQRSLTSWSQRENIILNYRREKALLTDDFGNTFQTEKLQPVADNQGNIFFSDIEGHRSFITGQQAYQYRVKLAVENLKSTFASVFGTDATRFIDVTAEELSGLADRTGAGASLLASSNANYGDRLRLFSQETGKQVHLLAQDIANKNLLTLQSHLQTIKQSSEDSAELVAIVTRLRRSAEKFTILGPDYGIAQGVTDKLLDGAYLVDKRLLKGSADETLAAIKEAALSNNLAGDWGVHAYKIRSTNVASFLQQHMAISNDIVGKRKALYAAQGVSSNLAEDTLYVPGIDTRKVPYFAFVRPIEGRALGNSEVVMISARTDQELMRLASQVDTKKFEVIFKKDSERFHKALGDYEYVRAINETNLNSAMQREGKLGDFLPSFNTQDVLEDFVNFHQRQATQLVRDGVSTRYAQTIAELQRLSEQYTASATSKAESLGKFFQRTVKDPYDDYIKTMLDISKRSEFTLLHQTNEFVDALGTRAYRAGEEAFKKAARGEVSWEEANAVLERYGLGAPFETKTAYELAQTGPDRNLLKMAIHKANMILATATLRLDFANSLVNIISTPIMLGTELSAIRHSVRKDPQLVGALAELTSVKVPGQEARIPSTLKLLHQAVKNYWGPEKKQLIERYIKNGDIKNVASQFHEMLDDLSLMPKLVPSEYAKKVDKWVEKLSTATGNNFAEQFTRFVSADVMRQITEPLVKAGKMSIQEQNAFMSVFVNRVQGNYIASQRPILFQGTLGSAIGLFQTYQFNMLQQLFRHIENRSAKAIATMAALQTSVFGLNGLPLFEAINTHIVGNASINDGHRDLYSLATQTAGKELGDWLMYGTASALPILGGSGPSLYTRGDLNPRHISIIPVSPLDVPAVDGTIRFVSNLINVGKQISGGADVSTALLEGLEHNSLNRPLAGLAQAIQGYSTTGKGSLIAAQHDFFSIANASRILGAKPLDESVALNTKFRLEAYKAADKARLEDLGKVVKSKLRKNVAPTDEEMLDFMGRYAASGGRIENFSEALQRWSKDANMSVLNQVSAAIRSPYGQRFVEVMGGEALPDYRVLPETAGEIQP